MLENKGDWIAGADPELVDITDFTAEGDDYWTVIYATVQAAGQYKGDIEGLPGWIAIDISLEEGHDLIKIKGAFQGTNFGLTQAKEDALNEFFRNHSDLGDSTFYLVKRWTTDLYKLFPNGSRTKVKYMQSKFVGVPKSAIVKRVLTFECSVRSAWSV